MRRMVAMMLLMAVVLSIGASADARMKLGPRAAVALASVSGDGTEELDSKLGLALGGFIDVPFGSNSPFGIRGEVNLVNKGAEAEVGTTSLKLNFDYVEVPVMVKYNIPVKGNIAPNFFAGPVVGILVSAKQKYDFAGDEQEVDIKEYLKSTDFSLCFGGGVDIVMGTSGVLILDVRYELGFTNVLDDGGEGEIKNNAFMIGVGWGFNI